MVRGCEMGQEESGCSFVHKREGDGVILDRPHHLTPTHLIPGEGVRGEGERVRTRVQARKMPCCGLANAHQLSGNASVANDDDSSGSGKSVLQILSTLCVPQTQHMGVVLRNHLTVT